MRISDWSSDVCSSDLNQITSLQNEAQSLINQARNLASLPHSSLQQIQQSVQRTQALLTEAQNIAFDVQQVDQARSEEHTSELQSLMRISYAVFCLKKKNTTANST